ncbi:Putative nuclease HARBI1 [Trachymyrmex cornetzi]|uniref:Putative nuclease HARBI1 n=1 Tax=Trachymyrmex cornetzi TaxID=471704 RepID=A0A151ISM1_9HYME|nr:Putative nuclease HARBI1 [Trachymyrmex cornetzi]
MNLQDFDDDIPDLIIENEELVLRAPKRYIRDGHNYPNSNTNYPFEFYNEIEFKRRFRFSKEAVMGLVSADIIKISQPSISRIISRVSVLLAPNIHHVIKMLSSVEQINVNHTLFQNMGYENGATGLPGVDGAIDCTHIRLTHTRFQGIEEIYRNRKGYFSLMYSNYTYNCFLYMYLQAVVGPRMEFLDIVPEWPGSQHDSRIFQNSRLYMRYMKRELTGILIGDNGYPCLPFLLTPILNPETDEQIAYNIIHRKTRLIVERTFGVWKRRFPCLARGLTTKLICSTTIVVACAVLHNLSLIYDNILPDDEENEMYNDNDNGKIMENNENHAEWQPADGFIMRNAIIERLFH